MIGDTATSDMSKQNSGSFLVLQGPHLLIGSEQVWNMPRHWHRGNGVMFQTKAKIQEKLPD